ncbi:MAG: hypothetical protein BGO69_15845 [Bacteroidetes bacterium 46-16]|nr:MAG: hypothetical protein BGO69_15845 [Bacteroidetes bacterium 46-16]
MAAPTVNLVRQPNPIEPINDSNRGECIFVLNGTGNIQQNDSFQYVIDLYEMILQWSVTYSVANNLGRYKLPAGPDGRCVFAANQILQSQTLNDYVVTLGDPTATSLPITAYAITYGYEYNPYITFTSITPTTIGPDTFATLILATASDLAVGDLITISKDILSYNSFYNGVHTVQQVTSPTEIVTDVLFNTVPIVETGKIIMKTHLVGQSDRFHTYTGTRQFNQYDKNFGTQFLVQSVNSIYNYTGPNYVYSGDTCFLTNYQDYKPIYLYQFEDSNFIMKWSDYPVTQVYIYTFNGTPSPTTLTNIYFVSMGQWITDPDEVMYKMGTGSLEVELWYGIPLSTSNVTHYAISVSHVSFSGVTHRAVVRRQIINSDCGTAYVNPADTSARRTANPIPDDCIRLKFLNPHGGWDYWNFSGKNTKETEITKNLFKQAYTTVPRSYDRGDTVLSVKANQTITVTTNWIKESDYAYLDELLRSPEVYIVTQSYLQAYLDVEIGLKDIPVIVTTPKWQWKRTRDGKLFFASVDLKYSYDIAIQNS